MFSHGGYWRSGSKDDWGCLASALNEQGFNVVIPNYRLVPEVRFPTFVNDAALALQSITQHASEFNGDPQNVFVIGHSTGAHIASILAFDASYLGHDIQAAAVVSIAGVYDLTTDDLRTDAYVQEMLANHRPQDVSPTQFISHSHPPFLAIYGKLDQVASRAQTGFNKRQLTRDQRLRIGSSGACFRILASVSIIIRTFCRCNAIPQIPAQKIKSHPK